MKKKEELSNKDRCPIAVIILTHNEELSVSNAVNSVIQWAEQVFILDSYSTDKTVKIVQALGAKVFKNKFKSFTEQRNWALKNLPVKCEWVLFLDADEYLSEEIKKEISGVFEKELCNISGFYSDIKFIFLGKWLKHGDIYRSLVRIFKIKNGKYIKTTGCREKLIIEGKLKKLKNHIVHDDKKSIIEWVIEQKERIVLDAEERYKEKNKHKLKKADKKGTVEGKKSQWMRENILMRLPGPVRPFAQFLYRYIFRFGFLDGWKGFIYHFLLQLWYPVMVEVLYLEMSIKNKKK
ncbi:MAG: glycosyltransferase family 2 protein [Spirochaetia bacterium]|nr:glycosyltransferase family 2 protein [Spirochaetia bacterium]